MNPTEALWWDASSPHGQNFTKLSQEKAKNMGVAEKDRPRYRTYSFPKSNYTAEQYGMHMEYQRGTFQHVTLRNSATQTAEQKTESALPMLRKKLADLEDLGEPVSAKMLMQYCKSKPTATEVGEVMPVGKTYESIRTLLLPFGRPPPGFFR
jgi:hypothetical protein